VAISSHYRWCQASTVVAKLLLLLVVATAVILCAALLLLMLLLATVAWLLPRAVGIVTATDGVFMLLHATEVLLSMPATSISATLVKAAAVACVT
jgi:hypothetical protein